MHTINSCRLLIEVDLITTFLSNGYEEIEEQISNIVSQNPILIKEDGFYLIISKATLIQYHNFI